MESFPFLWLRHPCRQMNTPRRPAKLNFLPNQSRRGQDDPPGLLVLSHPSIILLPLCFFGVVFVLGRWVRIGIPTNPVGHYDSWDHPNLAWHLCHLSRGIWISGGRCLLTAVDSDMHVLTDAWLTIITEPIRKPPNGCSQNGSNDCVYPLYVSVLHGKENTKRLHSMSPPRIIYCNNG